MQTGHALSCLQCREAVSNHIIFWSEDVKKKTSRNSSKNTSIVWRHLQWQEESMCWLMHLNIGDHKFVTSVLQRILV